jgi:fructose-bisphosphate aldolase, class I
LLKEEIGRLPDVAHPPTARKEQPMDLSEPAQLGAHIIKVKPPTAHLELAAAKKVYEERDIDISTPAARIRHVVQSAFNGRRIVVFSGGEAKDLDGVFAEVRAVRDGGANGSIIGRNTFQRPKKEALDMLGEIVKIYQGRD